MKVYTFELLKVFDNKTCNTTEQKRSDLNVVNF